MKRIETYGRYEDLRYSTIQCNRAEGLQGVPVQSLALGERARWARAEKVLVWKALPWRNNSRCARAESSPLGEQVKVCLCGNLSPGGTSKVHLREKRVPMGS